MLFLRGDMCHVARCNSAKYSEEHSEHSEGDGQKPPTDGVHLGVCRNTLNGDSNARNTPNKRSYDV